MADVTISGLDSGIPNKNSAIIPYSDGSTTYKTSPSGIVAASPGCVLQVVQGIKTDYWSFSTPSGAVNWYDVSGLSVSITINNNSSKVYIDSVINGSSGNHSAVRLVRGTSALGVGNSVGSRAVATAGGFWGAGGNGDGLTVSKISYLDNPGIGTHTYKIQVCHPQGSTIAINGTWNNADAYWTFRTSSTITAMEIAG